MHFVHLLRNIGVGWAAIRSEVPDDLFWYYVFQKDFCFPVDYAAPVKEDWPQPGVLHLWFSVRLAETGWPNGACSIRADEIPFRMFVTKCLKIMQAETRTAVFDALHALLWHLDPDSSWVVQAALAYNLAQCFCLCSNSQISWPVETYAWLQCPTGIEFVQLFWDRVSTWPVRATDGNLLTLDFVQSCFLVHVAEWTMRHEMGMQWVQRAFNSYRPRKCSREISPVGCDLQKRVTPLGGGAGVIGVNLNPAIFFSAQSKRGYVESLGLREFGRGGEFFLRSDVTLSRIARSPFLTPENVVLALPAHVLKMAVQTCVWYGLTIDYGNWPAFWEAIDGYLQHAPPPSLAWLQNLAPRAKAWKDFCRALIVRWTEWSTPRSTWAAAVHRATTRMTWIVCKKNTFRAPCSPPQAMAISAGTGMLSDIWVARINCVGSVMHGMFCCAECSAYGRI